MKKQNLRIENSITVVVGGKASGVTTENKKHINRYIKERKKQGRAYRVLIVDFNDNGYKGTKDVSNINRFKNEVVIIGNSPMNMKQATNLLDTVCHNYTDGLLIIEGLQQFKLKNKYLMELSGIITCNRIKQLDIIICYPSIFRVHPKILQNASYIRVHNTIENPQHSKIKDKMYNFYLYMIALNIIRMRKAKNSHALIDLQENKIFGCSKADYLKSALQYIVERIKEITTNAQLNEFANKDFITKYYSDTKNIPISNIDRKYNKN